MPIATREAEIIWEGPLASGTGTLSSGSGALGELPVTWASRTEQPDRKTSPEELIAAAHASCFAMALSLVLGENHTPAERVMVDRGVHVGRSRRCAADHDDRSDGPRACARPGAGELRSARRACGRALPGLQRVTRERRDRLASELER